MSTVDKMLIKGIRSFSPENKHVITFYKPLTLIVGPNGAGKTTIIECLKHACTGELPPNARSGHSFIHDPKVAGETETKGQIKLRFKTAAGKDVVCIRSFQLTQKASKMEYKAIESVLQTVNPHTGEKVCLSYRCADMDREISALMGVSKAILENVIFAHQDEANWPLQDPSTLKKKFDDIFSATRYTKALEVIKKLHKDQAQEIKMYRLKLENLQTLKDAALKLRESITQDQERAESVKAQILHFEKKIQDVEVKIQQTEATLKDLRKLQDEINTNTTKRSTLFKLQQSQLSALAEENEDTDEELIEWQTKFQERIALLQSKISKLERDAQDATTMSSFHSKDINDYIREAGKLQAEAEAYLSLKHDRDATVQRIVVQHNLGSAVVIPLSDDMALNLTNRAKARLKDLQKDLSAKRETNDVELKGLWKSFESVSSRCSEIEGQKMAKLEKKSDLLKRMKEVEEELGVLQLSEVDLSRIDAKEKFLESEVQKRTLQVAERDFESNIHQKRTEIFSLDHKIKSLYREKDVIASDSEDRVKLGLKKEELEGCKRKRAKIMDEYTDKIRTVLKGRVPSDKDLKKEITSALCILRKEHDDVNAKSTEAEKEMKLVEMKIEDAKDNLLKLQKEMEAKRKYIGTKIQSLVQGPVEVDAFPKVLQEAMERRDVQKSEYSMANGMRQMFDPFERVARAHHYCPCCERPFSAEEEDQFVRKQRVKNANSMEGLKLLAISSSNADAHFQQLDKLRTVYEEYVKLSNEAIPSTERNLKELAEELQNKIVAFEDLVGVVAQTTAEKDLLESLIQPVENADRLWQEMQSLQRQVADLEYKLDVRSQGAKSLEEIQTELNNLQETRDNLSRQLENLQEEQRHMNNDLSNLQMRWHASREEKLQASNKLIRVENLADELGRLSEQKSQLDLDEQILAEAFVPLSKEKDKLLKNYEELKVKFEHEYNEQAEILRNFQQEVETLATFASKIKEYDDARKDEKLKELQEKQSLAESQLRQCESRKQEITAELQKSKELLHKQDQLKRNIDDNLNYRRTKAEVVELTHEIESLEEKVVKIGGFPAYEADLKRHMQEKERLLSELNRCHGTLSVYQSNISKHKLDLKQSQYNDIDKRYFDQLIQLKTTEMANKDLDRYYHALDKALMRFHTMKMEEINKIIKELWQQTYRGQDIDYISIHSDSEGSGSRSYSYRVVMQTGDAELEMRGRCSAGQKVLASLIIRLALAETFCLNCGILALDEPTTNLDGPNSESLASALLRIMEDRKGQENFQLIVITHDERFAQLIGQRQHAERYYRISKDELQHSIIESQDIFD
ncbi:DNA repair protein RAD50 [Nymphaea colorata]|nr:DNA repair protein RAD50 [Nymphaea colorata]